MVFMNRHKYAPFFVVLDMFSGRQYNVRLPGNQLFRQAWFDLHLGEPLHNQIKNEKLDAEGQKR